MQKHSYIAGIDIGSSFVRSVIAHEAGDQQRPRIVGVGVVPTAGIRRGVIIDVDDVTKCVADSMAFAQRMAGIDISSAVVSIGGSEISFQGAKGVVAVGRADGEVIEDDVNRVIGEAQVIQLPMNREIVHVVPRKYRLDDVDNIKDPIGMKGVRLEVDALIVETAASHIKNITKCMYQAGIEIDDIVLAPLAAAKAVLSKKQKELGVVLVAIGGGTTSLAVYEEGELVHTVILPVGAGHITNDIAIGLRTSIDVAEKIKMTYGVACCREVNKKEEIDLSQIDSQEEGTVSRYHVAEIIEARLEEIFDLVHAELKSIGKAGLLPAGAVLIGGGANMPHVVELAKEILRLPIQIGYPEGFGGILDKIDNPDFATVSGLVLWGCENGPQSGRGTKTGNKIMEMFSQKSGKTAGALGGWLKKFLP